MPLKKLRCRWAKEDNDGAGDKYDGREDGQTLRVPKWRTGRCVGAFRGAKIFTSRRPSCRTQISRQNCWITSLTFYKTQGMRSRIVVLSPNHGSPALEDIFSPASRSSTRRACDHGKPRFRILPPLPRLMPDSCSSNAPRSLRLQMWRREAGFRLSHRLCTLNCGSLAPE